MLSRRIAVAFTLFLLGVILFPAASAQFRMGPPRMSGVWNPVVGSGAVYNNLRPGRPQSQTQFAIVGKEQVDGATGYWMEMVMDSPQMGGEVTFKTLVVLVGDQVETRRTIMQMAGEPPMEMPAGGPMGGMGGRTPQSSDIRKDKDVVLVGTESITVLAGTFNCQHYRSNTTGAETWISTDVAPYGLVKSTSSDGSEMVLAKVLTNAKSKITGRPQPFDPSQMMRQRPND